MRLRCMCVAFNGLQSLIESNGCAEAVSLAPKTENSKQKTTKTNDDVGVMKYFAGEAGYWCVYNFSEVFACSFINKFLAASWIEAHA